MKYNITNLDKFKNNSENDIFEKQVNKCITEQYNQFMEDRIKELISPYVEDIESFNVLEIATMLAGEDLELSRESHCKYDKFIVKNTQTGEEDYFTITQPHMNVTENNGKYEMKTYISDIIRGIKD